MTDRPLYRHTPIYSIGALGRVLGYSEQSLLEIARRAPKMYIGPIEKPKKNGGIRYVYDTRLPLKPLLKKINAAFLQRVEFPEYLTGSIKARDYSTNAEAHENSVGAITEDISNFFPSIRRDAVYAIWRGVFKFGHEPAMLLSDITTKDGVVFQGTPTSSYLANLAFWDIESSVVRKLLENGIRYSRFVDDVTLSSTSALSKDTKTWAISQIYAMMGRQGYKPKRAKHEIMSGKNAIKIMGLVTNTRVTLPTKERSAIRAEVHHLEMRFDRGGIDSCFRTDMAKTLGRVGKLKRFHMRESQALRERLGAMKPVMDATPIQSASHPGESRQLEGEDALQELADQAQTLKLGY